LANARVGGNHHGSYARNTSYHQKPSIRKDESYTAMIHDILKTAPTSLCQSEKLRVVAMVIGDKSLQKRLVDEIVIHQDIPSKPKSEHPIFTIKNMTPIVETNMEYATPVEKKIDKIPPKKFRINYKQVNHVETLLSNCVDGIARLALNNRLNAEREKSQQEKSLMVTQAKLEAGISKLITRERRAARIKPYRNPKALK
jgi:hypothetical protein